MTSSRLQYWLVFIFGLFLLASIASAQSAWQSLGVNEGLAQGFVPAMVQDSRGFMWFGTSDGLSRYDGYSFKNYRNDPKDTTSISSGIVFALHECTSGLVWIGFLSGNIDIFDRATERFIHLNGVQWSPTIIPQLFSIAEDSAGVHWVGRRCEILRIEMLQKRDEPLSHGTFHVTALRQQPVSNNLTHEVYTYADRSSRIWVWMDEELRLLNHPLSNPPVFKRGIGQLRLYPNCFFEDRNNIVWIAICDTLMSYLYSYNPVNGKTISVIEKKLSLASPIPTITSDEKGFLWRAGETILKINTQDITQQTLIKKPIIGDPLRAMIDSSGLLWIGTNGYGINKYNPSVERFGVIPHLQFQTAVLQTIESIGFPRRKNNVGSAAQFADLYHYAVFRDHNGNLWFPCVPTILDPAGYNTEMLWYDSATGRVNKIRKQMVGEVLTPQLFPASQYVKMLEDNNNMQWFIGWNALSAYDSARNVFRHYFIENGTLAENKEWRSSSECRITSPRKDKEGFFWFGVFQQGLFRFNPITLDLKRFSHDDDDSTSISSNNVISILEDPAEPHTYFWVGTEGAGLNKFEKATGKSAHITTRDGLPNNVVYTIFPDKLGRLWMSTNNGFCRLDPKTMTFKYYDIYDGLQGMEFNRERNFQTADGKIFLEGTGGMNVFYPEEIVENPHVPKLVFTDFKLHGRSVSWLDPDSPLKGSITETKEIVLPYEQNILSIEFAALDYSNPGSNEYSYRLEGYSDEWTKPSKEHAATFTNLSPGTYILRVRGSNNDDIWNETGISLSIIILPPWYRTWWAYGCYLALVVITLYFFRRYDLKRIRLKDQLDMAEVKANQLKEVDQLKMQFFQNISHEFRTPLTLILGPIERLINGSELAEPQKRDMRMMRRNAQKLLRLINQLLDISKIEAGGMKLQASKGNFVSFIRGITMSFHSLAERKEIFFDVQTDFEELDIYFDKEKMEKIIINLLSNAFKFTPDHGEIVVTLSPSPPAPLPGGEEGVIRVSVRDTGIGIPPEKLPRIFDRFYQVDSSSTRMQEGTGIGLALVKDLVTLHHGTITVTSEPGKGSEFVVTLPIGKSHLKPEEIVDESSVQLVDTPAYREVELESSTEAPGGRESSPVLELGGSSTTDPSSLLDNQDDNNEGKPILLIIEDNTDVRNYIRSYLHPIYAVMEARDGAVGVEMAKEIIPDLIISDVMMPKMDGYEVCSRLKQDEKTSHVPIILLTAKASKEDKIGGLETGADDYLIKPFDSTELLVRVKNLIESRKRLREKFGKELVTLKPAEVAVNTVDQQFLNRVMQAIEKQMGDEQFGVNELADAIGLSSKQLQRKLKGLANTTASDFIRSFRLQRAKELLLKDSTTIAEIAYSVGFGSPAYFTKCFSEQFGMTPSEARKSG